MNLRVVAIVLYGNGISVVSVRTLQPSLSAMIQCGVGNNVAWILPVRNATNLSEGCPMMTKVTSLLGSRPSFRNAN